MRLPEINGLSRSVDTNIEFRGINHNLFVGENEFFDTYNLCSTNYPVMTPRAARAYCGMLANAQGLYARGKIVWAADGKLYYGGEQVQGVTLTSGEKQFVGMGAYVIVFPDGVRYNTSTGAVDWLAASWTGASATVTLSRQDGEDYENVTTSDTEPANPQGGDYWLDTSVEPHVLRVYSATGSWNAILTTYARIEAAGLNEAFKVGDAVTFAGGPDEINGTHEIVALGHNETSGTGWAVISCVLDQVTQTATGLSASRDVPQMDYVTELNNRLWGCSNQNHEIYCCRLGDPTNWKAYGTGAGDAWAATIGSSGDFTGACAFGGAVLFWKEDILHKVMGTKPGNFQIIDTPVRGVQKGSEKSLCIVNEVLMYKSRDGVMVYDGASPMNVGEKLGTARLYDACAGVEGDRYYISMRTEGGTWGLWVFNEAKGLWHREDETHALAFAALDGQLYFLRADGHMMAVRGNAEKMKTASEADAASVAVELPFDWWAETGDMLLELPDNKYISRIQIKASVDKESALMIEAMYDSDGQWRTLWKRGRSRKASFTVPLMPARCDHMRLRVSGHGHAAVYAISKEIERGSEL